MELLNTLQSDFPNFTFKLGKRFQWSPHTQTIWFTNDLHSEALWSLLHEVGHAILRHEDYRRDIELISLEVAAWEKAKDLAAKYGLTIDQNHIEDCLDGYRSWLHQRSTCPECHTVTTQASRIEYQCFNCGTRWKVSLSPLCRVHRRKQKHLSK